MVLTAEVCQARARTFGLGCTTYRIRLACRADRSDPPMSNDSYSRISELPSHAGQTVRVRGWVTHVRSSGKVAFVVMRDGTGLLQAVLVKNAVSADSWDRFGKLTQETSIEVEGDVRPDARAPGGYELAVKDLSIYGTSPIDYPIQPKEHGIDFLLDNRHFWLRTPRQRAIARVRADVEQAIRAYFYERDFTLVDTPILTAAIGERSGLFGTEYFDEGTAFLAQTGQLYGEAAAAALGKIYCFGPTFRAEKSKTRRHLTEFWMVEPEVAWNDSDANMRLQGEVVCHIGARRLERRPTHHPGPQRGAQPLEAVRPPFTRISYTDAVAKLKTLGGEIEWGQDLGGEAETLLAKQYDRPV